MNVAVFCDQHSMRLGHFALSHTVSSRKSSIKREVNCKPPPEGRFFLSHGGNRSRGGEPTTGLSVTSCIVTNRASKVHCTNWRAIGEAAPITRSPATAKKPTSKGGKKKAAPDREHDNERLIAQNRRARHEYEVLETLECGIVLVGSEVKSLRTGRLSLEEAYARIKDNEVWLMGCDIPEYAQANQLNHVPKRP